MKVTARDVYGEPLPTPCDIWLDDLGGGSARRRRRVARAIMPSGRAEFSTAWQQTYRIRVVCEGHVEAVRNVDGSVEEVELAVPIDPSAVVGFEWPDPMPDIPGIIWNADRGTDVLGGDRVVLDARRRGTALNIWAKLWATSLGMAPAAAYIEEVLEVRDDRIICRVSPAILDAIRAATEAGAVELVTSAFGHEPPDGHDNGPSIKTKDDTGGLQVSIFTPRTAGQPLLADIDIDEEGGFYHALRAIGHGLTGDKTDPVEVQQILASNGIDPGWKPLIA